MKIHLKNFITLIIFTILFASNTSIAFAGSYGYGNVTSTPDCFTIDQMVNNPAISKSIEYIDNILATGVKYQPNQAVIAKITIKNTSNQIVPNVIVTNDIPKCFTYIAGPGSLNKGGNVLTIPVGDLKAQEQKVMFVTYKAGDPSCYPNQAIYCVTNKMRAQGDVCNVAEDNSQLCIENTPTFMTKGGVPISQTPTTGPEFSYLFVTIQAIIGGIGYVFVKKSKV